MIFFARAFFYSGVRSPLGDAAMPPARAPSVVGGQRGARARRRWTGRQREAWPQDAAQSPAVIARARRRRPVIHRGAESDRFPRARRLGRRYRTGYRHEAERAAWLAFDQSDVPTVLLDRKSWTRDAVAAMEQKSGRGDRRGVRVRRSPEPDRLICHPYAQSEMTRRFEIEFGVEFGRAFLILNSNSIRFQSPRTVG